MNEMAEPASPGLREAVERARRVFGWQHLVRYSQQTPEWLDRTLTAIVLAAHPADPTPDSAADDTRVDERLHAPPINPSGPLPFAPPIPPVAPDAEVTPPPAEGDAETRARLVDHPAQGKAWVQIPHRNDIGSDWIAVDVSNWLADRLASVQAERDRLAVEVERLQATAEAVEALCSEWESPRPKVQGTPDDAAAAIRAVLDSTPPLALGDTPQEQKP